MWKLSPTGGTGGWWIWTRLPLRVLCRIPNRLAMRERIGWKGIRMMQGRLAGPSIRASEVGIGIRRGRREGPDRIRTEGVIGHSRSTAAVPASRHRVSRGAANIPVDRRRPPPLACARRCARAGAGGTAAHAPVELRPQDPAGEAPRRRVRHAPGPRLRARPGGEPAARARVGAHGPSAPRCPIRSSGSTSNMNSRTPSAPARITQSSSSASPRW